MCAMMECRLLDHLQQLGGYAGAGRHDADAVVFTIALDDGTGLLGDEFSGTGVPLLEVEFPVAVEPSGGDIAQVHGRRAQTPESAYSGHGACHAVEVVVGVGSFVIGETRGDDGALQLGCPLGLQAAVGAIGALALHGPELLVERRGIDIAHPGLAVDLEADGDAVGGDAGAVVHGAVEGVDDPLVACLAMVVAALLAQDGVVGEGAVDEVKDNAFAALVGLGDDVVGAAALVLDAEVALSEVPSPPSWAMRVAASSHWRSCAVRLSVIMFFILFCFFVIKPETMDGVERCHIIKGATDSPPLSVTVPRLLCRRRARWESVV